MLRKRGGCFIGAGTRLLAYDSRSGAWRRQWVDEADVGFWGWRRHGDSVLMSAELELAAWTIEGEKLWTTFVEPPWGYDVVGDEVRLDVMGTKTVFGLRNGPEQSPAAVIDHPAPSTCDCRSISGAVRGSSVGRGAGADGEVSDGRERMCSRTALQGGCV